MYHYELEERWEQGDNVVIFETKEGRFAEILEEILCSGKGVKAKPNQEVLLN